MDTANIDEQSKVAEQAGFTIFPTKSGYVTLLLPAQGIALEMPAALADAVGDVLVDAAKAAVFALTVVK